MRTISYADTPVSQITKRGEELYQRQLKEALEPEHRGEYVVIEPESGDYFTGKDPHEANQKAQETLLSAKLGFWANFDDSMPSSHHM